MFSHLHVHTEYSLLDGLDKPKKYFAKAVELGQPCLAITEHGNMDGYVKAIQASKEFNVKYIPGCEFYIVDDCEKYAAQKRNDPNKLRRLHAVAWAKNIEGVQALFRLLHIANEKFAKGRPVLEWKDIQNETALLKNVMLSTACTSGLLSRHYKDDVERLIDVVEDFYIEVMPHRFDKQIEINKNALKAAEHFGMPIIVTNDCHYVEKEGAYHQEILLAIQQGNKWNDQKRWRFNVDSLYMMSSQEMLDAFKAQGFFEEDDIISYMANTYELTEKVDCKFAPKEVQLPDNIVVGETRDASEILMDITLDGFEVLAKKFPDIEAQREAYLERIGNELELICRLGFEKYFLLVTDLVQWAKSQGQLVGPGRGSVGGCLVAYCLGIIAVDPMKYDLVFARFISEARIDLPDIDIDFEDIERDAVKEYLRQKYGKGRVANVSTFSEMHGRGALRDVARVFDIPAKDVDAAAKAIVVRSGGDIRANFTIEDAFKTFEEGKKFYKKYPDVSKAAMALESCKRNSGMHAAGFVIAPKDFSCGEYGYLANRSKDYAINWDKKDLEYMGLMKLDVLGLNALTILNKAKQLINERHGIDIDFYGLPLDDPKVLEEFNRANTVGVFQLGSYGIRKLCGEAGVTHFDDLVDINALFRPGTLRSGMVTEYVHRKKGQKKIEHLTEYLKRITESTYGIVLYQEQVMRVMYDLAGMPWKTADRMRKVMSKSEGEHEFMKFRQMFVDGCVEKGTLDAELAGKVFDDLRFFAHYGFNKAHAVEYTMIAYWCMHCKVHFPAEFFEAMLTWGTSEEKMQIYIDELKRLSFNIHPVDINKSRAMHWAIHDKDVIPPIVTLKGIGERAAKEIERFRDKNGNIAKMEDFDSHPDLYRRVVNKKVRAVLIEGGAMESIGVAPELGKIDYTLYPYSWETRFDIERLHGMFDKALSLRRLEEKARKAGWYFAQLTETKFGYHQKVKQQDILGQSDNLGGVYGYARDLHGDYVMVTFKADVYQKKKYEIEHGAGKWILFKGAPITFSNNILVHDVFFEEEIYDCSFEGLTLPIYEPVTEWEPDVAQKSLSQCNECSLRGECFAPVPTEFRSNMLVLGEAPGKDEDKERRNFCGKAGQLLWRNMELLGLERDFFSIANTAKCYPSKTKNPKPEHIGACSKWLARDLASIQPIVILSLGKIATEALMGEAVKITEMNGKVIWHRKHRCWVIPAIHPSSVLRGGQAEDDLKNALKNFKDKMAQFL